METLRISRNPIAVEKPRTLGYNPPSIPEQLVSKISDFMGKEKQAKIGYPDELKLKELLSEGIPMLIPRSHLFGRQENASYDRKKRKAAEHALREEGVGFLLRDPIIVCALPNAGTDGLSLVIIDGHHRTRYSSKFGIHSIPSIIYTPEQITEAMNIRNGTTFAPQLLIEKLNQEVSEAIGSFKTLPDNKQSHIVSGITSLYDLSFERFSIAS